jgi:hypothetical protein
MPDAPEALTDPAMPADALASLEASLRSGARGSGRGPASLARRLGSLTSVLVLGIVAAAGFIGGVQVQKRQGPTAVAATGTGTGAGARAAAAGGASTTAAPAPAAGAGPSSTGGGPGARAGTGAAAGAGTGQRGAGGALGGAGAATAGQVKLVDGTNIYVTDAQGNVVKVVTSGSSRFTRTGPGSIQDVRPGDTVIVQGQKADDGIVTATAVTDSGNAGAS